MTFYRRIINVCDAGGERMNFLLVAINAKYIHSNPAVYSLQGFAERVYPGVVSVSEYTINHHFDHILSGIFSQHPDAIGISTYIWNIEEVKKLLRELPKILPDMDIWLGGPEVSYHYEEFFKNYPKVRGVIVGEGETSFTRIVGAYVKAENESGDEIVEPDFSDIPNLALRERPEVIEHTTIDMDALPFIYEDGMSTFDNRIVYYESSRGCPFRCSYCLSSLDKTTRFRSLPFVFRELQYFLDQEVPQVKFIDRTFNADKVRTKAIWNYILEHDNGKTNFHFEIAGELMDKEEIDLLRKMRPGLVQLEIGVQTTNQDALIAVNRSLSLHKLTEVVRELTKAHNVHIHLDLIAGLPYEGLRSFRSSFNDVYAMAPTQLQLGFLKVLKGSPIEADCEKYGILYSDTAPYEVLATRWLKFEELQHLKYVAEMVEIYYNRNQFTKALPYLVTAFDSPYDLFSALADYYVEKNYFEAPPARAKKYEILIAFANEKTTLDCEEILEALTMDYYLRENPKSKPDFVKQHPAKELFDMKYRDPLTGNFRLMEDTEVSEEQ